MRKTKHNIGDKIGKLTIIDRQYPSEGHYKKLGWLCRCDCGVTKFIHNGSLGVTRSCGCIEEGNRPHRWEPEKRLASDMYKEYMRGAKVRDKSFSISKNLFSKLIYSPCYYCGVERSMLKSIKSRDKILYTNSCNGIDRLDNSLGYTDENCVSCCKTCNQAKHILSIKEFLTWVKRIYDFQVQKENGIFKTGKT